MVAHGCKMPPKYEWVNLCDNECVIMSRQTDRQKLKTEGAERSCLTTTATMRLIIGGPIDIFNESYLFYEYIRFHHSTLIARELKRGES